MSIIDIVLLVIGVSIYLAGFAGMLSNNPDEVAEDGKNR